MLPISALIFLIASPAPGLGSLPPDEPRTATIPNWIVEAESLPGLVAVGSAAPNTSQDRHQQRLAAVFDARLKLAPRVEAKARERMVEFQKAAGSKASVVDPDQLAELASLAAKSLTSGKFGRVNPEKIWFNPDDRSLWVLLQVPPPAAEKGLREALVATLKEQVGAGHPELAPVLEEAQKPIP